MRTFMRNVDTTASESCIDDESSQRSASFAADQLISMQSWMPVAYVPGSSQSNCIIGWTSMSEVGNIALDTD